MKIIKWSDADFNFIDKKLEDGVGLYPYSKEQENIVIEDIRKHGYKFPGEYHQNGEYGCPYFDDGIPFICTYRQWGYIMSCAYPEEFDPEDDMKYCKYAWFNPRLMSDYVYPENEEV